MKAALACVSLAALVVQWSHQRAYLPLFLRPVPPMAPLAACAQEGVVQQGGGEQEGLELGMDVPDA